MYTKFSGENGQTATGWLYTLQYELPGKFSSSQWLECVLGVLEGDAARWAYSHPKIGMGLNISVDTFEALLVDRFDPDKKFVQVHAGREILELYQKPDENLLAYYHRTLDLLHAAGGQDAPGINDSLLKQVVHKFANGFAMRIDLPNRRPSTLLEVYRYALEHLKVPELGH